MSFFDLHEDHLPGKQNKVWKGIDMLVPVFGICAFLVIMFITATLMFPERAKTWLFGARDFFIENADWLYSLSPIVAFLFAVWFVITPLGSIRIGGADARPEFDRASWIAMLFAAGVGTGYMFFGAAEPLAYYTGWSGTPLNVPAESDRAASLAVTIPIIHWGISAWTVASMIGLALAFYAFNRGLPLSLRSLFYPFLGNHVWGWPGHVIDIFAVVCTVFGLSTSIGIGATQATSGLYYVFGIEPTFATQAALIMTITVIGILSVSSGLSKGIKLLSDINMVLAFLLLVFVVTVTQGFSFFPSLVTHIWDHFANLPALSNWVGRTDLDFFHGWTIFYWAWWLAWAPFMGLFIARISRGRTVREFILFVNLAPFIIAAAWFSAFGDAVIDQHQNNIGEIANGITKTSLVLFQLLEQLPFSEITSVISIILLFIFLTTSIDSGALVVDMITAGGKTETPLKQRVFWASVFGFTALGLLFTGDTQALKSLQAGTIAASLPFSIILFFACYSVYSGLKKYHKEYK